MAQQDVTIIVNEKSIFEVIWNADENVYQVFIDTPTSEGLEFIEEFENEIEAKECVSDEIRKFLTDAT